MLTGAQVNTWDESTHTPQLERTFIQSKERTAIYQGRGERGGRHNGFVQYQPNTDTRFACRSASHNMAGLHMQGRNKTATGSDSEALDYAAAGPCSPTQQHRHEQF